MSELDKNLGTLRLTENLRVGEEKSSWREGQEDVSKPRPRGKDKVRRNFLENGYSMIKTLTSTSERKLFSGLYRAELSLTSTVTEPAP